MSGRRKNPNGSGGVYARPSGLLEAKVFVTTPDGRKKRVSVYGRNPLDLEVKRVGLVEKTRKGIPVAVTTLTVQEYVAGWLRDLDVRPTTYRSYEQLSRLYIVPGLGRRKLAALSKTDVQRWLTGLKAQCQCCAQGKDAKRVKAGKPARCCALRPKSCCEQFPGTGTQRSILRVIRAALQDAVDDELLTRNVARLVKMPTGSTRKVRPWTQEEAETFLSAARSDRLYALWAVALAVGLRRGEALGLRWENVDLENGLLSVEGALYRVDGKLGLHRTKTESSEASVPLPPQLVDILRTHRKRQRSEPRRRPRKNVTVVDDLVFTTTAGTPIEPRNVNRAFGELCKRAGVRRIRLHDLRHSCATLLLTMGVEAVIVRRILRHSSLAVTTGTYIEVIEKVQREAVAGMGNLLDSGASQLDGNRQFEGPVVVDLCRTNGQRPFPK